MSVRTELENITPTLAAKLLAKNTNNRNLNSKTVSYYKDMIERGRWLVNGESIKIAEDGTLLDGQHRLEAVRQADIPVKMFVVYGVSNDAFMTIDAGRPRRNNDYLKVAGYQGDLTKVAAASRVAMSFTQDGEFKVRLKVSPDELIWWVDMHPLIFNSVEKIGHRVKIASASITSGLHYVCSVVDDVAADLFFEEMITGAGLKEGSPVLALRNRLISYSRGGGMTHQRDIVHFIVTAFNAYVKNEKLQIIRRGPEQKTILKGFKGQLSDKAFLK